RRSWRARRGAGRWRWTRTTPPPPRRCARSPARRNEMHVIVGLMGLAAVLAATVAGEQTHQFTGLFHKPALLLVGVAPLCIGLISYGFEEVRDCARELWQAVCTTPARARSRLYEELTRFAAEARRGRP